MSRGRRRVTILVFLVAPPRGEGLAVDDIVGVVWSCVCVVDVGDEWW